MGNWPQISLYRGPGYSYCFCCGKENPIGLKLHFAWDGKTARAEFTPSERYQGWQGILHGGITVALLDEAMSYAAFFEGLECVTADIRARLKKPVPINQTLIVTASISKRNKRLLESRSLLSLRNGTVLAEGKATHFITGTIDGKNLPGAAPTEQPTGVIWDMDGVIVDTAPYHFTAWQQTFAKRGIIYTLAQFKQSFGRRNEAIIPEILGKPVSPEEIAAVAREKEALFRRLAKNKIKPFPGAVELIKRLALAKVKMALVSSTPPRNIDAVLNSLEIKTLFQTIISGADVAKGKPDPEGFLLAASRLEIKPESCVVIEDSTAGISAAKNAGMKCLAVTNTRPKSALKQADLIIDSLNNIDVDTLKSLIIPAAR